MIAFDRELDMVMEDALGSHVTVRKVLELLDLIEATRFDTMSETLRQR